MNNNCDPTPAMIERCKAWIQVVETLEKYLVAAAQRYDWISEATGRISREMPQPEDLGDQFAPIGSGGIKDLFARLWWDLNLPDGKCADDASSIIKNKLLSEVASLKEDLNGAISDFTNHSASFEASTTPNTAQLQDPKLVSRIKKYISAVDTAEAGKQPEMDPFLIKMALDQRIDSVVRKHNTQADSYAYVQDAAKRVDGAVVERLQSLLRQYTDIAEGNGKIIANGARQVSSVFVHQPKLAEYKHWLQSSKAPRTFVGNTGSAVKTRESDTDLGYPKENSPYAKAIRTGALERRTRILKTYSVSDYVLTPLSLIELRQNEPVWSIDLLDATLVEDHKANSDDQFVVRARQHGSSSGKMHNWVFRAKVAANWKRDLAALLSGSIPENLGSYYSRQKKGPSLTSSDPSDKVAGMNMNEDPFASKDDPRAGTSPTVPASAPGGDTKAASPSAPTTSFSDASAATAPAATAPSVPTASTATPSAATVPTDATVVGVSAFAPATPAGARDLRERSSVSPQATVRSDVAAVNITAPHSPTSEFPPSQQTSATASRGTREIPTSIQSGTQAQTHQALTPQAQPTQAQPSQTQPPHTSTTSTIPAVPGPAAPGPSTPVTLNPVVVPAVMSSTGQSGPSSVGTTQPVAPRASGAAASHSSEKPAGPGDSDSEVSDVDDNGYTSLQDEEEGTMAWMAQRDLAVFEKPTGMAGASESIQFPGISSSIEGTSLPGSATFAEKKSGADVWEYDAKHKDGANTFRTDPDFRPAEADLPVEKERRLSTTHHKYETPALISTRASQAEQGENPEAVLERRRSSVSLNLQRKGSRKATGSYGDTEPLKPLSNLTTEQKKAALDGGNSPLYFSSGLPKTTGGQQ